VILALYNPQSTSMVTEVRVIGPAGVDVRQVRVPARGTVQFALRAAQVHAPRRGIGQVIVQTNDPILPLRAIAGQASSPSVL
jgi:hypothetical protein